MCKKRAQRDKYAHTYIVRMRKHSSLRDRAFTVFALKHRKLEGAKTSTAMARKHRDLQDMQAFSDCTKSHQSSANEGTDSVCTREKLSPGLFPDQMKSPDRIPNRFFEASFPQLRPELCLLVLAGC